jgi:drug/metabolite transporter (DMT)-like permease
MKGSMAFFGGLYHRIPASLRGAVLILASTLFFSAMHGGIRHVATDLHPFEVAFFRNLFGLVAILPLFGRSGLAVLRTTRLRLHALRGGLQVIAMLSFFTALTLAPLAEVSALSFTAPLFASLGATLFLGEVMRLRRWSALIVGFLGALIIIRPGLEAINLGTLLVLFASALWATAMLVIKTLGRTESSITTTAYMGLFLTPLSFLPALFVWQWPSWEQLAWLVAIGALGTFGHLAMAQAFKEAEATAVLPFDFTRLIWASVIGYLAFAEIPDLFTWIGGIVIFSSSTYIAVREAKLKGAPAPEAVSTRSQSGG